MHKMNRAQVHKLGELMSAGGFFGAMFGGMTLDGPDFMIGIVIICMSAVILYLGSWLYDISWPKKSGKRVAPRHRLSTDSTRRDAVFQYWLEHGTLERR